MVLYQHIPPPHELFWILWIAPAVQHVPWNYRPADSMIAQHYHDDDATTSTPAKSEHSKRAGTLWSVISVGLIYTKRDVINFIWAHPTRPAAGRWNLAHGSCLVYFCLGSNKQIIIYYTNCVHILILYCVLVKWCGSRFTRNPWNKLDEPAQFFPWQNKAEDLDFQFRNSRRKTIVWVRAVSSESGYWEYFASRCTNNRYIISRNVEGYRMYKHTPFVIRSGQFIGLMPYLCTYSFFFFIDR